ncbi:MAG: DNA-processing protein DprA [Devosia sp.]|uniref:DNA-processing protein DprA n=1 Tax=Devosia sp. TaxID=1871048 RepID=UPI0026236CEC|nr:DNA-processing protein DprA [Devosia sp.]MDB5585898.1 DNA-processing protein DprA [Devosia sp.]
MTTSMLSPDAQATLLLVGRFGKGQAKPLTRTEFNRVAQALHRKGLRPSDLFQNIPDDLSIDTERIKELISRGTALALAIDSWRQVGIQVVSRADPSYPARFKSLLKGGSNPILYYAGQLALLERSTISVVGSRDATNAGLEFARGIGERAAAEGVVTVSGDARGIDRAAMDGASERGGDVIGILADSLSKAVLTKRNRQAISSGKLLLLSHVEPDARFTVAQAMERNRYIYTAGDATIVADSDIKGGTWNGAIENLKYRWAPAFVRTGNDARDGNVALLREGLNEISDTWLSKGNTVQSLLQTSVNTKNPLPLFSENERSTGAQEVRNNTQGAFTNLFMELILPLLETPMTTSAVADALGLQVNQAELWLDHAATTGLVYCTKDARWQRVFQGATFDTK